MVMGRHFFFCIASLLVSIATLVTGYQCQNGVKQCQLGTWTAWTPCSSSCNGGVSMRWRPVCCPPYWTSLGLFPDCARGCNISVSDFVQINRCGVECTQGNTINGLFIVDPRIVWIRQGCCYKTFGTARPNCLHRETNLHAQNA